MSAHEHRAVMLIQQQRFDLAQQELRQAVVEDPLAARPHALLALCLRHEEKFADATQEAHQSIFLDPEAGFGHYALSIVLEARNRSAEAKTAIEEAVRLDPDNPDYFGQLALVEFSLRDWNASLAAAENGLKADPEHVYCTNLRVQALTKLGRRTDADAAVESVLRREPENAYTHANRGWTLLEQRNPAKAMEHFREALRLEPNLDWARAGIVEALKARNFLYRWLLGYFFWMSRLSRRAQWGVIVGLWLAFQLANYVNANYPQFKWITGPLMIAYLAFFLLTWLARPVFNTLLRFSRFGRMVLTREDRWQSNAVCLLLLLTLAAGLTTAFSDASIVQSDAVDLAIGCGFMSIFVANIFNCARGWPRRTMALGAAAYVAVVAILLWKVHRAYVPATICSLPTT
jgi:tetratricopeptide (TPR) repeat protein